jgi:osmotically-inducible protein OsmY
VDASEIEIVVNQGHVQLQGTVASRLMMQKALAHAGTAPGVIEVENHLHVDRPASREAA